MARGMNSRRLKVGMTHETSGSMHYCSLYFFGFCCLLSGGEPSGFRVDISWLPLAKIFLGASTLTLETSTFVLRAFSTAFDKAGGALGSSCTLTQSFLSIVCIPSGESVMILKMSLLR